MFEYIFSKESEFPYCILRCATVDGADHMSTIPCKHVGCKKGTHGNTLNPCVGTAALCVIICDTYNISMIHVQVYLFVISCHRYDKWLCIILYLGNVVPNGTEPL